jgi:hypothetical protein
VPDIGDQKHVVSTAAVVVGHDSSVPRLRWEAKSSLDDHQSSLHFPKTIFGIPPGDVMQLCVVLHQFSLRYPYRAVRMLDAAYPTTGHFQLTTGSG